jgi:hypothetical protein
VSSTRSRTSVWRRSPSVVPARSRAERCGAWRSRRRSMRDRPFYCSTPFDDLTPGPRSHLPQTCARR